jgi:hypothetical protein
MKLRRFVVLLAVLPLLATGLVFAARLVDEYKSGIVWPEPAIVDPGMAGIGDSPGKAPSDAIVLFGGENLDAWEGGKRWKIADGVATAAGGGITTKQGFGDCQVHVEFATPDKVEGSGQGRGNSGVYLMGRYEVQILDSHDNKTYYDGQCGSIYKQQPPMVNASRQPGQWQALDILFTAPKFDKEGRLLTPGYVTVLHNGIVIHNHFELQGSTSYTEPPKYTAHGEREPLQIQFHGNPVRFRNVWVREAVEPLVGIPPEVQPKDEAVQDLKR